MKIARRYMTSSNRNVIVRQNQLFNMRRLNWIFTFSTE